MTTCVILVEGIMRNILEIILNLDKWFKRKCCLKIFLSRALVVLLFGGAEPIVQFY